MVKLTDRVLLVVTCVVMGTVLAFVVARLLLHIDRGFFASCSGPAPGLADCGPSGAPVGLIAWVVGGAVVGMAVGLALSVVVARRSH